MEIKLEYLAGLADVTITTDTDDPDELVKPDVEFAKGDLGIDIDLADVETLFYGQLQSASGFYGHTFDIEDTTNLDLVAAVYSLQPLFDVLSVKPELTPNELEDGELT